MIGTPEFVPPTTKDEFKACVEAISADGDYQPPVAFGLGIGTIEGEGSDARIIDVHYTRTNFQTSEGTAAVLAYALGSGPQGLETGEHMLGITETATALELFAPFDGEPGHGNIETLKAIERVRFRQDDPRRSAFDVAGPLKSRLVPVLGVVRNWEDAPVSVSDVYLRLYALSQRFKEPNTIQLDGAFGKLVNVVVSEEMGTFTPERWNAIREQLVLNGLSTAVRVYDKFPRMLDHVVPSGVRVADPSRVRLGAFLGDGTTVMHEGFVNFNAGTLGTSMVEGRISAGVVVGDGTDIGGGVSTMGTLSGGNKERVSIGENCLLEANSGVGIALGNDCRVEAGTYVKSTTPVTLPDGEVVKASALSGRDNMMFRRNAITGAVEMVPNDRGVWGGLNADLHQND